MTGLYVQYCNKILTNILQYVIFTIMKKFIWFFVIINIFYLNALSDAMGFPPSHFQKNPMRIIITTTQ
jgi:hypothetical protein